jgi:hypothetical protein
MKKKIAIIVFTFMLLIGFAGTFGGSAIAEAATAVWNSCQRGMVDCPYPGACRSYIDTNNDDICDRSQPAPQQEPLSENTTSGISDISTDSSHIEQDIKDRIDVSSSGIDPIEQSIDVDDPGTITAGNDSLGIRHTYYFIPILLVLAILYYLTWLLSKRKFIRQVLHRRIWNIVLLVSTVASAPLGLFLILNLDFNLGIALPFNMLFWHVEAGIAMGIIAAFHVLWHWKYFVKIVKTES